MNHSRWNRIAKVLGASAFALVAAVACGENFRPNSVNMSRGNTAAAGGMSLAAVTETSDEQGVYLTFNVIDGARAVPNLGVRLTNGETSQSSQVDGILYSVQVGCSANGCNEVIALLNRNVGGQRTQSAHLVSRTGGNAVVGQTLLNTSFQSTTQAQQQLSGGYGNFTY